MFIPLFYVAYVLPYRLFFEDTNPLLSSIDNAITVFFILDMFLQFFTTYHTDDFKRETNHCRIAMHYARTWFLFDLVASIPLGARLRRGGGEDGGPPLRLGSWAHGGGRGASNAFT